MLKQFFAFRFSRTLRITGWQWSATELPSGYAQRYAIFFLLITERSSLWIKLS
jgi:hypothetical protein